MDIVRALSIHEPVENICNTWVRAEDNHIVKTDRRHLIENLDEIPFPDWNLFDRFHHHYTFTSWRGSAPKGQLLTRASVEGSRGCPYKCTYCTNSGHMQAYKGKGTWRREKSPRRMIDELKAFRETVGGLDFVHYIDDVFMTGVDRTAEFCKLYKREINVPFSIMERPEMITEEKIKMLADAGLEGVAIGFESGDEHIRNELLNRRTEVDVLKQAFLLPIKYGVKAHAFTLVGLPGQDEDSMLKTWELLREIKPTSIGFSIFRPMYGTALYEECVRRGMHDPQNDAKTWSAIPIIKHDILDDHTIIRYKKLFSRYAVSRGLWPIIAFHLGRRYNWVYRLIMRSRLGRHKNHETGQTGIRNTIEMMIRKVREWFKLKSRPVLQYLGDNCPYRDRGDDNSIT